MASKKGRLNTPGMLALSFYLISCITIVNGQYQHPKEYLKQSNLLAPAQSPYSINERRIQVQAAATGTPFESLVTELLDATIGGDLEDTELEIDLPYNVSAQCKKDFTQFTKDLTSQLYALTSKSYAILG